MRHHGPKQRVQFHHSVNPLERRTSDEVARDTEFDGCGSSGRCSSTRSATGLVSLRITN